MSFDLANLRQHRREYIHFYLRKFGEWREKNVGVEACFALAEGTAGEHFKCILNNEEMEALNAYLREGRPESREPLTETYTVDLGEVGIREVD